MKRALAHRAPSRQERRRGFTLTEIAIVLGIVGLILGAIWVAAAAVYNNLRISHANTQILQTAQALRTLYATQNTIGTAGAASDVTGAAITAGAVPKDMVNGTNLLNPWGGNMWVASTSDNVGFVIEMDQIPQAACINLVSTIGGVSRDPGLFMAQAAAGAAEVMPGATLAPLISAVQPTTAAAIPAGGGGTGCAAAAGTLNLVEFGFLLKGG